MTSESQPPAQIGAGNHRAGLEVAEARSGEEAILEARRKGVDLLVADFRLPGMTGAELMKKFRIINPQIKIIMITGVSTRACYRKPNRRGPMPSLPNRFRLPIFSIRSNGCWGWRAPSSRPKPNRRSSRPSKRKASA